MLFKNKNIRSEGESRREIINSLTDSNMYTGSVISAGIVIIQIISALVLFFRMKQNGVGIEYLKKEIASIVYFSICVVFFIISVSYRLIPKYNKRFAHFAMLFFLVICYVYGCYSSVGDFVAGKPLYLLIVTTLFLPIMFYAHPIFVTAIMLVSYVAMIIGIEVSAKSYAARGIFSPSHMLNLLCTFVFFIAAYIMTYKDKIRSVRNELRIREINANLEHISKYDALTSLKNRHALRDDYETYVRKNIVVMMTDVDDFKFYNDTYGHDIGDEILTNLGNALSKTFSDSFCYRFGGDEFLVIIPGLTESQFKLKITEWRLNNKSIDYNGIKVKSSCSCGYIYGMPESTADLRRMISLADVQLYEAKHRGKNCEVGVSYIEALYNSEKNGPLAKQEGSRNDIDDLTGTCTQTCFINKAWLQFHNLMDINREIGIIYFDVHHFKTFNERYGYTEGDKLLKSLAETIKRRFPSEENSLISRFSDDHFVVLSYLSGVERKITEINEVLYSNWNKRINAGIYKCSNSDNNISLICDRAKMSCQSIKNTPELIFKYYDEELTKEHEKKIHIINSFDEALLQKRIKVFYQPIVDVRTNSISHFEALTRWIDPVYGTLTPGEFIPVLEEQHTIHNMDLYILTQVAKDIRENNGGFETLPVSVNISCMDFILTPMLERIEKILSDNNIPKGMICFEIKESSFAEHVDVIKDKLNILRQQGSEIWLDNFGSGSFMLSRFDEYEFDVIKIDRMLMKKFYSDKRIHSFLSGMISSSSDMGIRFLAQGIETQEEYDELKSAGCDKVQGYFFGQPRPFEELKDTYFF